MIHTRFSYGVVISSFINSCIIFNDTRKVKVIKDEFLAIERPFLLSEKIMISCWGGFMFWQFPFRIANKIQLAEINYKGYDKKDFGYIEKNTLNKFLVDLS